MGLFTAKGFPHATDCFVADGLIVLLQKGKLRQKDSY